MSDLMMVVDETTIQSYRLLNVVACQHTMLGRATSFNTWQAGLPLSLPLFIQNLPGFY